MVKLKTIKISEDVYNQLVSLRHGMDTFNMVIQRCIDAYLEKGGQDERTH